MRLYTLAVDYGDGHIGIRVWDSLDQMSIDLSSINDILLIEMYGNNDCLTILDVSETGFTTCRDMFNVEDYIQ